MCTNYNDGLWHGWNGGECPVHPKTKVELVAGNWLASGIAAREHDWSGDQKYPIIAFRVVKEFREPREWWIVGGCTNYNDADYRALKRRAEQAERREAALLANNDSDRVGLRMLNAERDALRADKAKLEGLVETLAEALSSIDPAGKLDCELRANALAEYQKWKEWK